MDKYFDLLKDVKLFKGIAADELRLILGCIGSEIRHIKKNGIILLAGDKPTHTGIVLSGQLHILREDHEGNRSLVAAVTKGELFAEALCCAGIEESPVTVVADIDSVVMLLGFPRILQTCSRSCFFHTALIENMMGIMAAKNLQLQSRMEIVGVKSVRARVTRYLESFIPKRGVEFTIPFNREELANFLCVDRSALSHELSRMKQEGLIDYRKNRFIFK